MHSRGKIKRVAQGETIHTKGRKHREENEDSTPRHSRVEPPVLVLAKERLADLGKHPLLQQPQSFVERVVDRDPRPVPAQEDSAVPVEGVDSASVSRIRREKEGTHDLSPSLSSTSHCTSNPALSLNSLAASSTAFCNNFWSFGRPETVMSFSISVYRACATNGSLLGTLCLRRKGARATRRRKRLNPVRDAPAAPSS